ncbi:MAG: RNA methyltransferase [Alistipes onderdonkii]
MTKADIQLVRALADKRGRTEHGLFVAEGEKLIGELRTSHLGVRKIFALEGLFSGPEVEVVGTKEMERLSLLKTASNSLALVEIPHYGLDMRALAGRLTLALDDVQNPGNLGTIVRLADWFGITDIVCSEASADCFNPKVVQATMGAILRVRGALHRPGRVPAPSRGRRAAGVRDFPGGENIYGASLPEAGIVVMGNEGRGISDAAAATVTRKLFIPPYPAGRRGSESLNVAMATGIVCAEFRRQASTTGTGQA